MITAYPDIQLQETDAVKLRGFFADLDQNDSNLHNHTVEGKELYRYPLIQYKIIKGTPVVVAVEEGIDSIYPHLIKQDELKIGDIVYSEPEVDIQLLKVLIGDSSTLNSYCFLTPWLALNQDNYIHYLNGTKEEKDFLLSRILIGNILSMCKGFDVDIENNLTVYHYLHSVVTFYKGKKMKAFLGTFQVNCCLPDMCGIGKGTSRGYGTVAKLTVHEKTD